MRYTLLVGLLLACCSVAEATPRYAILEGFELGNECAPIALLVEQVGREEVRMGLTQDNITTTVRSQLRAARLYRSRIGPYLYVNIQVVGAAVSVRLKFNKPLSDPISGQQQIATTWDKSLLGHGLEAEYVLSRLSRLTATFIDAYLRVNEKACKRSD